MCEKLAQVLQVRCFCFYRKLPIGVVQWLLKVYWNTVKANTQRLR